MKRVSKNNIIMFYDKMYNFSNFIHFIIYNQLY